MTQAQALTTYSGVTDTSITYYETEASGIQGGKGWSRTGNCTAMGFHPITTGNNGAFPNTTFCVPDAYSTGGVGPFWVNGYVYNYDLPILSCVNSDGTTSL
jgi:hypothetical protein